MTEATAGATDLLSGTAAPAAAPSFQPVGMPVVPAAFDAPEAVAARATVKERIGDVDFYKALKSERERGVTGPASTEWSALHRAGWPNVAAVATPTDIQTQANARLEEQWNGYFAALQSRFNLSEENRVELRSGVIREDLHRYARDEKDRLIRDKTFRTRLLDGERAANQQWGMITCMLSLRVR